MNQEQEQEPEQGQGQEETFAPILSAPNRPSDSGIPVLIVPRGKCAIMFFRRIDNSVVVFKVYPFSSFPRPAEYIGGSGTIHNDPPMSPDTVRIFVTKSDGPTRKEWYTLQLTNASGGGHNPWNIECEVWLCPYQATIPSYAERQTLLLTIRDSSGGASSGPLTRDYSFGVDCL